MTNYSEDPRLIRVDFFKQSGKWYTTEAVKWIGGYFNPCIHEAFALSIRNHFLERPNTYSEMNAICLKPYHEHSHPIQIKNSGWIIEK